MRKYTRGKYTFVTNEIRICDDLLYHLSIRPPMTDEEYDAIKYRLERIGGHWRERFGGFVFDIDPMPALMDDKTWAPFEHDTYQKWKIERQFYPTPSFLAKQVVDMCEIEDHHLVLEPSAGTGALLLPLCRKDNIIAVEIDNDMASKLQADGYRVVNDSFENAATTLPYVDRVVMNPPFGPKQKDIKHIMLAYSLLKDNGVLVAIMGENDLFYDTPLTKEFNEFLESVGAEIEEVPIRSFLCSGTRVDTVIVKIKKK